MSHMSHMIWLIIYFSRDIFNGDFEITLRDQEGNILEQQNRTMNNCKQEEIAAANVVADGDFDNGVLGLGLLL